MKTVLASLSNKEIYEQTGTEKKISSSGEHKSEEEEASASFDMKSVSPNPLNKEIHERIETNESNEFSSSGENKSEEEKASALVGRKSLLSNSPNKEIHERIETNKHNKFSSSEGGDKSEEEEASKGKESREINTNSSSCNDKVKSEEYCLCGVKKYSFLCFLFLMSCLGDFYFPKMSL